MGLRMPLRRFLKLFLSAVFLILAVACVKVWYSFNQTVPDIYSYTTYQQAYQNTVDIAVSAWGAVVDFLRGLTHDDWLTLSTVAIAIFTFSLWFSTHRLWKAGEKQIALAREEFIATHRPRVIVRFIRTYLDENANQVAGITIVNVGDTPATIMGWGSDIARRKKQTETGWEPPGIDASAKPIDPLPLKSGQRHYFETPSKLKPEKLAFLEEFELCVLGEIRYIDDNGTSRTTGFFRIYDPRTDQFVPSYNQEDEYQD